MTAQQKTNDQYTQYCAQYADLGFKIDSLVNQRREVKRQIEALNSSVPFILQAEADATTRAKEAQDAKDCPAPTQAQNPNGKTADFTRELAQPAEGRHKN